MNWVKKEFEIQKAHTEKKNMLYDELPSFWNNLITLLEKDIGNINTELLSKLGGQGLKTKRDDNWFEYQVDKETWPSYYIDLKLDRENCCINGTFKEDRKIAPKRKSPESFKIEQLSDNQLVIETKEGNLSISEFSKYLLRPLLV